MHLMLAISYRLEKCNRTLLSDSFDSKHEITGVFDLVDCHGVFAYIAD